MTMGCPVATAARRMPDADALLQGADAISFRRLDAMVEKAATRLAAAGCYPGTRVALLLSDDRQMAVLLFALIRLGAVACPLNTRNPPQTLRGQLLALGCRQLIAPREAAEELESPSMPLDPEMLTAERCFLAPGRYVPPTDAGRPAVALFTSGSTAAPKAALLTLGNLIANAEAANRVNSLQPGDRWLLSLPLFHVGGLGILFRCLASQAAFVLSRKNDSLGTALARDRVTHLSLVPTQLQRLLDDLPGADVRAQLKCILLGGAPAADELVRNALQAGLPVRKTYGLTEMASQVTTVPPDAPAEKQLTAGRLLPGPELKVAGDGELLARGPTRFAGYVDADSLLSPFDAEGWYATGDLGRMDSEGYLTVLGRKDNLFITGGENVQPEEVEAALCSLKGVAQSVVVPVEDREFGARPAAFVRMTDGSPDAAALTKQLEAVLPRYKIPIRFFEWPAFAHGSALKAGRPEFSRLARELLDGSQQPSCRPARAPDQKEDEQGRHRKRGHPQSQS